MHHRLTFSEKLIRCFSCGSVFVSVAAGLAEECSRPGGEQQRKEGIAVDEVRERIERELGSVMDRLRQLGGAIVFEEFPGSVGHDTHLADLADKVQAREEREVTLATRSLLVERANRLGEALERLGKSEYGICEECGATISQARLKAMPEVTTCVRCQGRLERTAQQRAQADVAVLKVMRKRNRRHLQRPRGLFSRPIS